MKTEIMHRAVYNVQTGSTHAEIVVTGMLPFPEREFQIDVRATRDGEQVAIDLLAAKVRKGLALVAALEMK